MSDIAVVDESRLIPGRDCGGCNACCVSLTIRDPDLFKPEGYRCRHALRDNSCAIYPTRPQTCREFQCGWRLLKWVRAELRPDRSGVLVRLRGLAATADAPRQMGVVFSLLDGRAPKAEGLAESVAAAVAAGLPTWVHIPGPPGFTGARTRIDEVRAHAVMTKDREAVLQVLRDCRAQGRRGPRKRILPEPSV